MKVIRSVLLVFLFVACNSNKDPDTSKLIPRKKMELVIYDMMLADRYAMQFMVNDSLKKNNLKWETMKLFNQVLAYHKVSKTQFFASMDFYMRRPEDFRVMIDSMVSISNKEKEVLYKSSMR